VHPTLGKTLTLAAALALTAIEAQAQAEPLPLDPLTPAERAAADTIARADARIRDFVTGGRSRLVNVDFIALKDTADPARDVPRRGADVLYYRTDRDEGLRAVVDLAGRQVTETSRVPGTSVPLSADEITTAARLALADPRVVRLFEGRVDQFRVATAPATREGTDSARVEGLRVVGATPADPCYRRRCVALLFRVGNRYVQLNRVLVDLGRQQVLLREGGR
jgi:Cu2+-containing amine oxidase